ncbi:ABC transporter substrate-binding protein [Acidipropionibacterium virtanenii]|uniref:Putative sugar-binding periplasmic protein n=1 Tax=Acidipropionibacterium virtanenii TaxID=2057246 RepID=A0A344URS6_9ACTN|nr:extracellular solute-binding protein [Acidipropionibacterium virtanenii]AXE37974.1 putative sugar-binding periplasmic protein [Acidipropionibacterium virtanenii]
MHGKKFAALATASLLVLSGTACGSGGGSGSSTETTSASTPKAGGAGGEVGVFTWWADGSEKKGLDSLETLFKKQYPNDTFKNLAVAGGSGSNAKAKLASDLKNGNPPGSFQGHAGAELMDYIDNDQVEPVDDIIKQLGGTSVFPKTLLDRLTVQGHIYSVPVDIHRANVVWSNTALLKKAGVTSAPTSVDAWLADMAKVKASGVSTPLSIGGTWTQTELLESILAANLGADEYNKLFTKDGKWDSDGVKKSIEQYKKALSFANTASDGDDWPNATDMVADGKAAYNVMGDWAVAEFEMKGKKYHTDWDAFAMPGKDKIFDFLADSFTLPTGTKNPEGTKDWLRFVGSKDAQEAFNSVKGSIPPRTDVSTAKFSEYQQSAMKDFKDSSNVKIVSSIAHGAAVPLAWSSEINTAMSKFYQDKSTDNLVKSLVASHDKYAQ